MLVVLGCNDAALTTPDRLEPGSSELFKGGESDTGSVAPASTSTWLGQCLSAAYSGNVHVWENFCNMIQDPQLRAECWAETYESTQHKVNWCHGRFG